MTDPGVRIRRVLDSKGHAAASYWDERGQARFRRELADDGLAPADVAAIIDEIDREMISDLLDQVLQDMKSRHSGGLE